MATLSIGIKFLPRKDERAEPRTARKGAYYPGDFIPEPWANKSWNGGRIQIGTVGE
jgi:hypothetical protein